MLILWRLLIFGDARDVYRPNSGHGYRAAPILDFYSSQYRTTAFRDDGYLDISTRALQRYLTMKRRYINKSPLNDD